MSPHTTPLAPCSSHLYVHCRSSPLLSLSPLATNTPHTTYYKYNSTPPLQPSPVRPLPHLPPPLPVGVLPLPPYPLLISRQPRSRPPRPLISRNVGAWGEGGGGDEVGELREEELRGGGRIAQH